MARRVIWESSASEATLSEGYCGQMTRQPCYFSITTRRAQIQLPQPTENLLFAA